MVWGHPLSPTPTSSLLDAQSVQTGPGTEDRDSGDQCVYSSQQYPFCPTPSAPILSPSSLVTPLPGSHDELVPGGIKSKLGEIPDSRVGEVRDPWLQIWQRQGETLLLPLHRVSEFSGITPEKITPAEVEYRAEAPRKPGFHLPTSVSGQSSDLRD